MKKFLVLLGLMLAAFGVHAQQVAIIWVLDTPEWGELLPMERDEIRQACHPELPVKRLTQYITRDGKDVQAAVGWIHCVPAKGYFVVDVFCYYAKGCVNEGSTRRLAFDLELRLRLPSLFAATD